MRLFSNKSDIQAFAKELALKVAKRYSPELEARPGKRPSVNRLTRIMEDACTAAVDYVDRNKLGWLGKARLGHAFRWELTDLGYSRDFVELATEVVVVHISRKRADGKPEEA